MKNSSRRFYLALELFVLLFLITAVIYADMKEEINTKFRMIKIKNPFEGIKFQKIDLKKHFVIERKDEKNIEVKKREEPKISFGLISDIQYGNYRTNGSRFYGYSLSKLERCVSDLNKYKLDFTIQLGDLIEGKFDNFNKVLAVYNKLKMPKYHVLGNHDFYIDDDKKNKVTKTLRIKNKYYDFKIKDWRFIVLDGNDLSVKASVKGSNERTKSKKILKKLKDKRSINANDYNGGFDVAQIEWLKRRLERSDKSKEKVMIFCHFPIYPGGHHNLWNDTEIVKLIESYKSVKAYISGHNHAGSSSVKNGIYYYTLRGMVETRYGTSYAVVEIYENIIRIKGIGRGQSRTILL